MLFNYVTEDNRDAGILGFADDNYTDGTQSGVFSFLSPAITALGYGLTTTQIHEFGHHIAMSHPHDGWDSEMKIDYGPEGSYYFAWAGDENNSMMSYVDLNWDFSQFDHDNFNRFEAAGYIVNANAIAGNVLASANAGWGSRSLTPPTWRSGWRRKSRHSRLRRRVCARPAGVSARASRGGAGKRASRRVEQRVGGRAGCPGRSPVGREYATSIDTGRAPSVGSIRSTSTRQFPNSAEAPVLGASADHAEAGRLRRAGLGLPAFTRITVESAGS